MNIMDIFYSIGSIISPIITRQIANYNWYYIYLLLSCFSLILLIFNIILYFKNNINFYENEKENNNLDKIENTKKNYAIIIYISLFLMFYLGLRFTLTDWFYTYLLEFLKGEKNGMSLVITLYMVGQVIGKIIIVICAYFSKCKKINIISIIILIIGLWCFLICMYIFKTIILNSILFIFIGICIGPILPNSISIIEKYFNKYDPDMLIKAISLCNGASYFGSSFFPFIAGIIIDYIGISKLLLICMIYLCLMSLLFIIFIINFGFLQNNNKDEYCQLHHIDINTLQD
jgi:fucose permease